MHSSFDAGFIRNMQLRLRARGCPIRARSTARKEQTPPRYMHTHRTPRHDFSGLHSMQRNKFEANPGTRHIDLIYRHVICAVEDNVKLALILKTLCARKCSIRIMLFYAVELKQAYRLPLRHLPYGGAGRDLLDQHLGIQKIPLCFSFTVCAVLADVMVYL